MTLCVNNACTYIYYVLVYTYDVYAQVYCQSQYIDGDNVESLAV